MWLHMITSLTSLLTPRPITPSIPLIPTTAHEPLTPSLGVILSVMMPCMRMEVVDRVPRRFGGYGFGRGVEQRAIRAVLAQCGGWETEEHQDFVARPERWVSFVTSRKY